MILKQTHFILKRAFASPSTPQMIRSHLASNGTPNFQNYGQPRFPGQPQQQNPLSTGNTSIQQASNHQSQLIQTLNDRKKQQFDPNRIQNKQMYIKKCL